MRLCLLIWLTLFPVGAKAAVSIFALSERYYLGHRPDDIGVTIHYFDVNGDSVIDVSFGNGGSDLVAGTVGINAIVHQLALPPNHGGDAVPLWLGSIIGVNAADIFPSLIWETGNSSMVTCQDIGCAGSFLNRTAALGLRFEASDGTHYGFMQFEPDRETPGGWIIGWAYESTPNTPITVQPIPEPTSLGLVAAGTSLLWSRNAANRKENKSAAANRWGLRVFIASCRSKAQRVWRVLSRPTCR